MLTIQWAGEELALSADRALYWPRRRTLIIADAHFGKAAAFRAHGVPVPSGTTEANLQRLDHLLLATGGERLIALGDLVHAPQSWTNELIARVARWRRMRAELEIILVRGNHDVRAGDPPRDWGITAVDEPFAQPPFGFCHHPSIACAGHRICGHIHPFIVLRDSDQTAVRCPAFVFDKSEALLPAFGAFTGGAAVRPDDGARIYAIADGDLVDVSRLVNA